MLSSHILVVDDDPSAREILEIILGTLHIGIQTTTDGAEAMRHIQQHTPELLVLDLEMPRVDGFAVLRSLRSRPTTAHIPVMVFTAQETSSELADSLGIPVHCLIRKGSLSMTELRNVVAGLLRACGHVQI